MEIRLNDGTLVDERGFRARYPAVSFPVILAKHNLDDFGAAVVFESPQPPDGYVRDGAAQDARGNWVKAWRKV